MSHTRCVWLFSALILPYFWPFQFLFFLEYMILRIAEVPMNQIIEHRRLSKKEKITLNQSM